MLNSFAAQGHVEIDSALMYQDGRTDEILGEYRMAHSDAKLTFSTKVNPWGSNKLTATSMRQQAQLSMDRLHADVVDILYLHAPDHSTPIEETLRGINTLHREGKFCRFGLSNYAAWQVADICHICRREGYVMPSVYQGMYNALTRSVESELLPALRRFNLTFYAYNPLAGGLLTGRYKADDLKNEPTGRFYGNNWAAAYQQRYWKPCMFAAIDLIQSALTNEYGDGRVTLAEASLRWMMHHSKLGGGDAVIVGASSAGHLDQNLSATAQGPLSAAVVDAFEQGWKLTQGECPLYFR